MDREAQVKSSFTQRHSGHKAPPIVADFPASARNGLMYLLSALVENGCIKHDYSREAWSHLYLEMLRITRNEFVQIGKTTEYADCQNLLNGMRWDLVFSFVERVYSRLLVTKGYWEEEQFVTQTPLEQVKADFA